MRTNASVVTLIAALALAAGCGQEAPTSPAGLAPSSNETPQPSQSEAFEVTGVVTDDRGVPVANVEVRLFPGALSARTDASGAYTIGFTGTRGAWVGLQIADERYEWYTRTFRLTSSHFVEDFRLHEIKRVTAGGSIVLSLTPDNGRCSGWLYLPCGLVRVAVLADGTLTVEAVPTPVTQGLPAVLVCCVSGDEVGGNPVTLPVTAGTEVWVEVGQSGPGFTINEVTVKTRFEPF